ncbi:hypothetical protein JOD54_002864 [Actinokineospora baliensis]|uniref:hypothetical protein n=1 Tax=Actinokineospora baliensis TaxID=547056 RepID=UPI00195E75CE|nr:hypothetical protein [Actinokineospora baliensis]MBM7772660.1 hypothetical protein [Actinokineospora baliensis]
MSHAKRTFIALSFATLALAGTATAATATTAASTKAKESCRTLIEKIPGKQGESRVVLRQCAVDPATLRVPVEGTKLITFYADINYGIPFEEVYGDDGACDAEGYAMPELENLNDRIGGVSSYIISNDCNDQIYYYDEDYEGARNSNRNDSPWVGATWNDHLYSIKLWHS